MRWWGRVRRIEAKLDAVLERFNKAMGKLDDLLTQMNDATNLLATEADAVAQTLGTLQAQLAAAPTVTADQLNQLQQMVTNVQGVSSKLKALAADPANPVPSPAPAPSPAPTPAPTT